MTRLRHYVLNGKIPVEEPDLMTWARWYEGANRTVARSERDDVAVSTVFLGLDHNFGGGGARQLFETAVLVNGLVTETVDRVATWKDAEKLHRQTVKRIFRPVVILHQD
jgi:hypothetical protein